MVYKHTHTLDAKGSTSTKEEISDPLAATAETAAGKQLQELEHHRRRERAKGPQEKKTKRKETKGNTFRLSVAWVDEHTHAQSLGSS